MKNEKDILYKMLLEANGFNYTFQYLNQLLIDNFLEKNNKAIINNKEIVNPAIVNGNFACEVYLKAILQNQNKKIPITHKLNELFSKISISNQQKIIEYFIELGYSLELFNKKLNYISNGFVIARYDYENEETYYLLSGFLCDLLNILKNIVEEFVIKL